MVEFLINFVAFAASTLILLALIPARFIRHRSSGYCKLVSLVAGIQLITAILIGGLLTVGEFTVVEYRMESLQIGVGIYLDGASTLMFTLVSFVGWVICRYSLRYLDGESTQPEFFRWTGFTIAAVSLLVISNNLLMFSICWVLVSLGLHQLLTHYRDRPAATRAAWSKFAINRVGDAALFGAIALLFSEFKTLNFSELFGAVALESSASPGLQAASCLLILAAITKSAQFPLHTWLPLTMETPTPVSALMHAGIVNAGGYLIIRTSPLVSMTPTALHILALVGTVTACFGAAVMLTQTSVKKTLAYSTIAQMGFMMLQCGLGAYSVAMLHIVAHSLYKAHAFLSSGSVVAERAATLGAKQANEPVTWRGMLAASSIILASFVFAMAVLRINVYAKPDGVLLGGILCLALTSWLNHVMRTGSIQLVARASITCFAMCLLYAACYLAVDSVVSPSLAVAGPHQSALLVTALVATGFICMFALQLCLANGYRSARFTRWYVHTSNGFYVENALRRLFGNLMQS